MPWYKKDKKPRLNAPVTTTTTAATAASPVESASSAPPSHHRRHSAASVTGGGPHSPAHQPNNCSPFFTGDDNSSQVNISRKPSAITSSAPASPPPPLSEAPPVPGTPATDLASSSPALTEPIQGEPQEHSPENRMYPSDYDAAQPFLTAYEVQEPRGSASGIPAVVVLRHRMGLSTIVLSPHQRKWYNRYDLENYIFYKEQKYNAVNVLWRFCIFMLLVLTFGVFSLAFSMCTTEWVSLQRIGSFLSLGLFVSCHDRSLQSCSSRSSARLEWVVVDTVTGATICRATSSFVHRYIGAIWSMAVLQLACELFALGLGIRIVVRPTRSGALVVLFFDLLLGTAAGIVAVVLFHHYTSCLRRTCDGAHESGTYCTVSWRYGYKLYLGALAVHGVLLLLALCMHSYIHNIRVTSRKQLRAERRRISHRHAEAEDYMVHVLEHSSSDEDAGHRQVQVVPTSSAAAGALSPPEEEVEVLKSDAAPAGQRSSSGVDSANMNRSHHHNNAAPGASADSTGGVRDAMNAPHVAPSQLSTSAQPPRSIPLSHTTNTNNDNNNVGSSGDGAEAPLLASSQHREQLHVSFLGLPESEASRYPQAQAQTSLALRSPRSGGSDAGAQQSRSPKVVPKQPPPIAGESPPERTKRSGHSSNDDRSGTRTRKREKSDQAEPVRASGDDGAGEPDSMSELSTVDSNTHYNNLNSSTVVRRAAGDGDKRAQRGGRRPPASKDKWQLGDSGGSNTIGSHYGLPPSTHHTRRSNRPQRSIKKSSKHAAAAAGAGAGAGGGASSTSRQAHKRSNFFLRFFNRAYDANYLTAAELGVPIAGATDWVYDDRSDMYYSFDRNMFWDPLTHEYFNCALKTWQESPNQIVEVRDVLDYMLEDSEGSVVEERRGDGDAEDGDGEEGHTEEKSEAKDGTPAREPPAFPASAEDASERTEHDDDESNTAAPSTKKEDKHHRKRGARAAAADPLGDSDQDVEVQPRWNFAKADPRNVATVSATTMTRSGSTGNGAANSTIPSATSYTMLPHKDTSVEEPVFGAPPER